MLVIVSQILLYISLSLLTGIMLSRSLFVERMPDHHIPKWIIYITLSGIAVFSFIPALAIILNMANTMGLAQAIPNVLFEFNVGLAWLFMLLIAIVFIFFFKFNLHEDRMAAYFGLIFVVILAVAQSFAGHAFEQAGFWGITIHTLHLLAVMVWSGLLIIFGAFTVGKVNWQKILGWFTPLALISIITLAVTGFLIANVVSQNPTGEQQDIIQRLANSWMVDYGQALLFKQLLLIVIIGFGIINGMVFRNRLKHEPTLQIQPWIRMEMFFILSILMITGFMSEQAIPNQVDTIIKQDGASTLYQSFYGQNVPSEAMVTLSLNMTNIVPFIFALLFFVGMIIFAKLRLHAVLSFAMAVCFVMFSYFGLMLLAT
jgi:putative copper resistance protein D